MKLYDILYPPKTLIKFLREEHGTLRVVKTLKKGNITAIESVNKERKYHVNLGFPAYVERNYRVYFLDYDTGNQLSYVEIKSKLNPDELDTIVGGKLFKDITRMVKDNWKDKIIFGVLGAVIGALVGFLIMNVVMNNKITEILQDQIPVPF